VDDHDGGLLGDERSDRLRAGVGIPIRIAELELDAVRLELLLETGEPSLGEIEVHGDRHERDCLTVERLLERLLERLVESLLRQRRRACGSCQSQRDQRRFCNLIESHRFLLFDFAFAS
jgi:hypothetical protein